MNFSNKKKGMQKFIDFSLFPKSNVPGKKNEKRKIKRSKKPKKPKSKE
jgi:hypothetical protein